MDIADRHFLEARESSPFAVRRLLSNLYYAHSARSEPLSDYDYAAIFLRSIPSGEISAQDGLRLFGRNDSGAAADQAPIRLGDRRVAYYRKMLRHLVRTKDAHSSSSKRNTSRRHVNAARIAIADRINRQIARVPVIQWRNAEPVMSQIHIGTNVEACLDYAFALVICQFAKVLYQCRLDGCGIFWLRKGDDKRRRFCRPKHRVEYGNADSKYRKQAGHSEVSVAQWREIREIRPDITVPKWQAIRARSPRLTVDQWIADHKNHSDDARPTRTHDSTIVAAESQSNENCGLRELK